MPLGGMRAGAGRPRASLVAAAVACLAASPPVSAQTPAEFIANNVDDSGSCQGVFVKVSVASGGESYTVQIGGDGAKREFKTR